jgi:hypothetical protein
MMSVFSCYPDDLSRVSGTRMMKQNREGSELIMVLYFTFGNSFVLVNLNFNSVWEDLFTKDIISTSLIPPSSQSDCLIVYLYPPITSDSSRSNLYFHECGEHNILPAMKNMLSLTPDLNSNTQEETRDQLRAFAK